MFSVLRRLWTPAAARRPAADGALSPAHQFTTSSSLAADGRTIYLIEGDAGPRRGSTASITGTRIHAGIVALSPDGRTRTLASLPGEIGGVGMSPDATRFVYTRYSSRSDIWVVDDFDALARRDALLARR